MCLSVAILTHEWCWAGHVGHLVDKRWTSLRGIVGEMTVRIWRQTVFKIKQLGIVVLISVTAGTPCRKLSDLGDFGVNPRALTPSFLD